MLLSKMKIVEFFFVVDFFFETKGSSGVPKVDGAVRAYSVYLVVNISKSMR